MPPRGPNAHDKGPQILTDRIRASEVRLIDGDNTEVVPRAEAERLADERGLDLVIISLDSAPPVVKLVDYGKFKFEAEKKAREAKKKQHVIDIKELKMSIRIDDHDYMVKVNHAKKFLSGGDKVKLSIRLKGRETQHSSLAFALAKRFVVDLAADGAQDSPLRMEGRTLTAYFSPLKVGGSGKPKFTETEAPAAFKPASKMEAKIEEPAEAPEEVEIPEVEAAAAEEV